MAPSDERILPFHPIDRYYVHIISGTTDDGVDCLGCTIGFDIERVINSAVKVERSKSVYANITVVDTGLDSLI